MEQLRSFASWCDGIWKTPSAIQHQPPELPMRPAGCSQTQLERHSILKKTLFQMTQRIYVPHASCQQTGVGTLSSSARSFDFRLHDGEVFICACHDLCCLYGVCSRSGTNTIFFLSFFPSPTEPLFLFISLLNFCPCFLGYVTLFPYEESHDIS